ncbi:MAG TPA: hypothetical protein ENN88_03585 [Candidatus Coatesbacteria bacterium]|nr:hypothetical protein [Candidatus Coatesbacteria bacterium]
MRKLLLVLPLALVCAVQAESPFAIHADAARAVGTSPSMPDLIGLNLGRFTQSPQLDQGGDDLGTKYDNRSDFEGIGGLEAILNPEYYVYIDNAPDQAGGPSYTWYDMSGRTQVNFPGPDDSVARLTLPGPFAFYDHSKYPSGGVYDHIYVTTNFLIGFEDEYYDDYSYADYANRPIPVEGSEYNPHSFIAAFWDDGVKLDNSRCYYGSVGNKFVISWENWGIRGYEDLVDGTVSIQVVLDMTNYDINIYYKDVTVPGTGHDYGKSATVGVEDYSGLIGFFYTYMKDVKLKDANALVIFEWTKPNDFNFPDPGGDDWDSDGAYDVYQGQPYGPFSWTVSSQNNPYGPSQISYAVHLWEDLKPADRVLQPDIVDGYNELLKYEAITTSTSHTIDTAGIDTVPYERQLTPDKSVTCVHYQILVLATDGWGYTEAQNIDAPGGPEYHYWLDVHEPEMLPDARVEGATWGSIKAADY